MTETSECLFCAERIDATASECEHGGESLEPLTRDAVFEDQLRQNEALLGRVDEFVMAYIRGAELSRASLGGVDLFGARLGNADLHKGDVRGAYPGRWDARVSGVVIKIE